MVLTVDPPWPPISGADLRNWRTALGASRLGPVTLVSVRGDLPDLMEPIQGISLRALSTDTAEAVYRRPDGKSHLDLTLSDRARLNFEALLDEAPSTLVIEHPGLCPLLPAARRAGVRLVLDLHNIESDLFRQSQPRWSSILRSDRAALVAKTERDAIAAVDEVWVCSATDAARVEQLHGPDLLVRIVPNAIPPASDACTALLPAPRRQDGPNLLFIGHLGYRPNVKAAEIAARRILPRLARHFAGARLQIAGRDPHRRIKALAGELVSVVANPAEVTSLYDAADLVVVPLRVGGGTRIKIIEAMARGVPVIATGRAAEGIGVTDGAEIRLAETPKDFEAAIADLWRNRLAYETQRRQAHAHVWRLFAPAKVEAAILDGLAAELPARPAS